MTSVRLHMPPTAPAVAVLVALSCVQMGGALAAAYLLWETGPTREALAAVLATLAALGLNVALFGRQPS